MSRFVRNLAFERELRQEPQYEQVLYKAGKEAKRYAVVFAPEHTGHYARSLGVLPDGTVYTDDIAGHLIEYGSAQQRPEGKKRRGGNPVYAPLRKGVRAAGLRFVPLPKH